MPTSKTFNRKTFTKYRSRSSMAAYGRRTHMLVYSVIQFAVAALFGLYLIARIFGGQLPPWLPVILHGLFAASGLLLLLYAAFIAGNAPTAVIVAAVLLLIAALGGFT